MIYEVFFVRFWYRGAVYAFLFSLLSKDKLKYLDFNTYYTVSKKVLTKF